tara:strand:- start:472 stop:681 length:210 start_codon:yes stop_codon:yes gene_type:complete
MVKEYTSKLDEGFQAIVLELIGKQKVSPGDFDYLVKGLLLAAHEKSDNQPILLHRTGTFICTDAFKAPV